jgi:hypothetical protein
MTTTTLARRPQDHGTANTQRVTDSYAHDEKAHLLAARADAAWSQLAVEPGPDPDPHAADRDAAEFRRELGDDGPVDWEDLWEIDREGRYHREAGWGFPESTYYDLDEDGYEAAIADGDMEAAADIRDILDAREAALYPDMADLGLDPTPRLRRFINIDREDDEDPARDYVGMHMVGRADPYYV